MTDSAHRSSYSIEEHRHRFAVWTAATAVRRGFSGTTADRVSRAIDTSGLRLVVRAGPTMWPTNAHQLYTLHERWAESIRSALESEGVSCSYGRAADRITSDGVTSARRL
jgi:hypothetical protein